MTGGDSGRRASTTRQDVLNLSQVPSTVIFDSANHVCVVAGRGSSCSSYLPCHGERPRFGQTAGNRMYIIGENLSPKPIMDRQIGYSGYLTGLRHLWRCCSLSVLPGVIATGPSRTPEVHVPIYQLTKGNELHTCIPHRFPASQGADPNFQGTDEIDLPVGQCYGVMCVNDSQWSLFPLRLRVYSKNLKQ